MIASQQSEDWPLSRRLMLAAVIFGIAFGSRMLMLPLAGRVPFLTFYPALILCFLFCGLLPGILAAAASAITGYLIFSQPFWTAAPTHPGEIATIGFLISAVPLGIMVRRLAVSKKTLAAANAKQRVMLDTRLFGIATLRGRQIVWANAGLEDILGYRPNALNSVPARLGYPDEAAYMALGEAAYPVLQTGETYRSELEMVRGDGDKIWVALSATLIDHATDESLWLFEDINARKSAEERLRVSESLLTRTGMIAGVGGWQLDLRSRALEWSEVTCRLHDLSPGYRPTVEEAIGYYAPEARPIIEKAIRRGIEDSQPWDLELPLISATGRKFWARVVGVADYEDGVAVRLAGAIQDVTRRREIERDLIKSQGLVGVTLSSIGDGVITTDLLGKVTWLNPVAERMTGWRKDQASGLDIAEILVVRHTETGLPLSDLARSCLASGTPVDTDRDGVLISHDGIEYGVEESASPIRDERNELHGAVVVVRDVTERRRLHQELNCREQQTEQMLQRLDTVFTSSPDAMSLIRIQPDHGFVYEALNPKWESALGIPVSRALGAKPSDVLPPEHAEIMEVQWSICVRERRPVLFDCKLPLPGSDVPVLIDFAVTVTPVFDSGGEVRHLTIVGRDVTERNRLEASMRQMHRMEAVGQLTAGVAHDFNNMLQSIITSLELLVEQSALSPDAFDYLTIADGAAQRGAKMVHRLLAFSRKQPLEPAILQPDEVFGNLAGLLDTTLGRRIKIQTDVAQGVWPVKADGTQLENCLFNLAINARDAMPLGGELTLSAANMGPDSAAAHGLPLGDYVCFAVRDNGAGMAPENMARVLEPFFTTKQIGEGNGLGLSMVLGFARQSGGDVRIESAPGQGSTISLWLPRGIAAADEPDGGVKSDADNQPLNVPG